MKKHLTLEEIASKVMAEKGFIPDFSAAIIEELENINAPSYPADSVRDMRKLMWVSIDNEDSRDLDQLTYAEPDRIFVAVADVDALVKKGSEIDKRAAQNTTTVYTPTLICPMLPLKLSNNLTSLNEEKDRCAVVIEVKIAEDGKFDLIDIYPALVHNHAKLNYPCVGAWLDDRSCKTPPPPIPGLQEQLDLQDKLARKIYDYRSRQGTLEFAVIQLKAVIVDGIPVSLEEQDKSRANSLIENYMIAANVAVTRYLKEKNLPTIQRVVRKPKRWDRIVALAKNIGEELPYEPDPKALRQFLLKQQKSCPVNFPDLSLAIIKLLGRGEYVLGLPGQPAPGHFDLAEREYCHATAPNRRFPDLIMQRLLKSSFFKTPQPYTKEELSTLAIHCTEREDEADRVERRLIKCAAAIVLQKEVGRTFEAMVIGSNPKGTWVRLLKPPVEGKLVKGFQKVDVGDFIKVRLSRVDSLNGHIDFQKI